MNQDNSAAGESAVTISPTTVAGTERTLKQVIAEWFPRLEAIREAWAASLPPDAAETWTVGAAYIRESSGRSLVGEAPDHQLRNVLTLLAQKRVYVAADDLFFDVQSATDIGHRAAFQRLFERAIAGGLKAIGVFINERLFRNLAQATEIKRQFRLKGIDLLYLGKYEGDTRNPAAWQLETMQDTAAEMHARNTSFYVGMHIEGMTRLGRPVGRIPEVYREAGRAPSFLGRRGSVLSWEPVEPLATVMREGCRRYLDGMSLADLAVWSSTTVLSGVTPKGREMDKKWWYWVLNNPKYAGYQVPTQYMGYKPGKESPKRIRRTSKSELVPCLLPALWTLDDYYAVLKTARKRWSGAKVRRTYKPYLLSGVAHDSECRHRMKVEQNTTPDGRYWMRCHVIGLNGREGQSRRADVAGRELDALLANLSFDDVDLLRSVEQELGRLTQAQVDDQERFRANPVIAGVRKAIASLGDAGMEDVRTDLKRRLAELENLDLARREEVSKPAVEFRRALDQLRNWDQVWRDGDVAVKNALLREAGMRVFLGPLPDDKPRRPAHILSIEVDDPLFALALGTAAERLDSTMGCQETGCQPNDAIALSLGGSVAATRQLFGVPAGADHVDLRRFGIDERRRAQDTPPVLPGGPWLTVDQYAMRIARSRSTVQARLRSGQVSATAAYKGRVRWWLIRDPDIAGLPKAA